MTKNVLLVVVLVALSTTAFAVDISLSAGGGGLFGYTFTRYTLEGGNVQSTQSMDRIDYGGGLFFDATYVEFSVLFQGGSNSYEENMIYEVSSLSKGTGKGSEASLGFSLLGKFPTFNINEKISWFPLYGIVYQVALMQRRQPDGDMEYDRTKGYLAEDRDKNDKSYPLSAWNSWWIDVGAGLDYNITGPIFLRGELLFGFRLPTSYELSALKVVQNPPMNVKNPKLEGLTGGPALKISVGYRF